MFYEPKAEFHCLHSDPVLCEMLKMQAWVLEDNHLPVLLTCLGVMVLLYCIGWFTCGPCLAIFDSCIKCIFVCVRVICYPCPCCRRKDPDDFESAENHGVYVHPEPLGTAAPWLDQGKDLSPPADFQDPMPKPKLMDLDRKTKCGGLLDPEAPMCQWMSWVARLKKGLKVKWLRAEEFFPEKPTLFGKDGPTPFDIGQGKIGDCYFLSSMSALAEDPENIKRLFVQKEATDDGIYCVHLMKNGKWHRIWLSDVFPTSSDSGQCLEGDEVDKPCMVNSKETNKLWPLLLEKAWAILFGGGDYLKVGDGGMPSYAMHALSGCPTNQYDLRQHSREDIFAALKPLKSGRIAACAFTGKKPLTPSSFPPLFTNALLDLREKLRCSRWTELLWTLGVMFLQIVRNICVCPIDSCKILGLVQEKFVGEGGCSGIVDGHAYSVLEVLEVPGTCGTERLVKLRNPWGDGEWRGRWNDHSCAWNEEAKELANLEDCDDGAFWMEFSDFEAYYTCAAICHLRPEAESGGKTWQTQTFGIDLVDAEEKAAAEESESYRISCRLSVPSKCSVFVTVDKWSQPWKKQSAVTDLTAETGEEDWEAGDDEDQSSGTVNQSWSLMVLDPSKDDESSMMGRNNVGFRWLDFEWKASHDGGPFADTASLSTTEMELETGDYLVVLAWALGTKTMPEKVTGVVAASAPGVKLTAWKGVSRQGSAASAGSTENSGLLKK